MNKFTKSNLTPGMVVETEKEGAYMILKLPFGNVDVMILMGADGFLFMDDYNEDLSYNDTEYSSYNIIRVYDSVSRYGMGFRTIDYLGDFPILWEKYDSPKKRGDKDFIASLLGK